MIPYSKWSVNDELMFLDNIGRSARTTKEMSKVELLENYIVGLGKIKRNPELRGSIPELRVKAKLMLKQLRESERYRNKVDDAEKSAC